MRTRLLVVGVCMAIWSSAASAQPGGAHPDLLVKKDGTVMRGTISEAIPERYVDILLPSGEMRRVEAKDIEYAGPSANAPRARSNETPESSDEAAPDRARDGARTLVEIEVDTPNTTVYVEAASAHLLAVGATGTAAVTASAYVPVCTAPCRAVAEPGSYRLALAGAEPGSSLVSASEPIQIDGRPTRVRGEYDSKSGLRLLGWGVLLAGIGLGTFLTIDSVGTTRECRRDEGSTETRCTDELDLSVGKLIGGIGAVTAGTVGGIILIGQPDRAHFSVHPLAIGGRLSAANEGAARLGVRLGVGLDGAF